MTTPSSAPPLGHVLELLDAELAQLSELEQLQAARAALATRDAALGDRISRAISGPSRRELARQLRDQGRSNAEIALLLDCREDYVPRLLADKGPTRGRGRPRQGWEAELAPLLEQGVSNAEIAQRLGWAPKTVANRASQLRSSPKE